MEATGTSGQHPSTFPIFAGVLLLMTLAVALLFSLAPAVPIHQDTAPENRMKMEKIKNSGRNGKHANQKAREAAEQKVEKVKEELEAMQKKPGVKTPEDKKVIEKLQDQLAHWRRKSRWSGENHSQKGKGN